LLQNPIGHEDLSQALRGVFVNEAKSKLGESDFNIYWDTRIKESCFQTAKDIRDALADAAKDPYKLRTSFEALKDGIKGELDKAAKGLVLKRYKGKAIEDRLISLRQNLIPKLQNIAKEISEEDKYWKSKLEFISLRDDLNSEQKSLMLTYFDEFAKDKLSKYVFYTKGARRVVEPEWNLKRHQAIYPTPSPSPTPSPRP
jgi:hypothetical protein